MGHRSNNVRTLSSGWYPGRGRTALKTVAVRTALYVLEDFMHDTAAPTKSGSEAEKSTGSRQEVGDFFDML